MASQGNKTDSQASSRFFGFLAFLFTTSIIINSQAYGAGTTAANFLKIPCGARAAGLGEAFTSVVDDASAVYWNAAGLTGVSGYQLLVSHNIWFQNINHSYAAFAVPFGSYANPNKNTIGFSMTYLGMDEMERRTSNTAASEGSFTASDMAVSMAYARNLKTELGLPISAGITGKFIRQTIDRYSAEAYAADLGLQYPVRAFSMPLKFGFAVQNVGTPVKFIEEEYPLPVIYTVGVSLVPGGMVLPLGVALDVSFSNDTETEWKVGTEYFMGEVLSLRLGYSDRNQVTRSAVSGGSLGNIQDNGLTKLYGFMAGFGVKIPLSRLMNTESTLGLDYAFVPYGDLGNTHRISLGLKW
ncbi:MAG: PorV/PorQ family protein [Endomicrobiales bacterium]|nr:PorV/PorQ family protein [Endomicrobiales bacterium]